MSPSPADGYSGKLSGEGAGSANRRPVADRVIGLTGPNAAGKGEAAACLRRRGFAYHSLSDIVREEASARGLSHAREDLIAVGNDLRATFGPGILARRILPRLSGRDVVDSIRNPQEVAVLRELPSFFLLGITAPVETRFSRARARGRIGDGTTLEEFRGREALENSGDPSRQQLSATLDLADGWLENSGSLEDLDAAIERILAGLPC